MNDTERLDTIERWIKQSRTGVTFDWVHKIEGQPSGYRFMRHHYISDPCIDLRKTIDEEIILSRGTHV